MRFTKRLRRFLLAAALGATLALSSGCSTNLASHFSGNMGMAELRELELQTERHVTRHRSSGSGYSGMSGFSMGGLSGIGAGGFCAAGIGSGCSVGP